MRQRGAYPNKQGLLGTVGGAFKCWSKHKPQGFDVVTPLKPRYTLYVQLYGIRPLRGMLRDASQM